tara:strand:- start:251 stop:640 length:390 start_codon:yes stop_codon:yes gene_type:complete
MTQPTRNFWTFETATTFWATWSVKDTEAAGVADDFHAAEQYILAYRAETLDEAATQLSTVIDAMIGGGRSDGMDVNVVRRTQGLLNQVSCLMLAANPSTPTTGEAERAQQAARLCSQSPRPTGPTRSGF